MRGDGDGWSSSPDGMRHWGIYGAAGLLLRAPLAGGGVAVLLQHRAPWSHQGGTWALPGGALDSDETPAKAAVREAWEEAGIRAADVRIRGERVTASAPSGWIYTTVVADTTEPLATVGNPESTALAWVPEDDVIDHPLHPGFAAAWPSLRATPARVCLDDIEDAGMLAAALPRIVDLADQGFLWLHTEPDGPGAHARIIRTPVPTESNGFSLTREQLLS
ncbi:NUDIX hydrolase [Nocardia bovistercoris]|uniref:NUDIX domain-containing protein n=1 Tax=Nocardia bovistercoris TaxID=2785916 RepID=A0A931IE59_9NOCA|nr:NUDIX hydrolase [Nocardia bovistercoris]MBH0778150.1 NUDIX domain-containing protein [Nocardia bovistercoris]